MATKVHHINAEESRVTESIDSMFNRLKGEAKLSEADVKARNIHLRLFVYETTPVSRHCMCIL